MMLRFPYNGVSAKGNWTQSSGRLVGQTTGSVGIGPSAGRWLGFGRVWVVPSLWHPSLSLLQSRFSTSNHHSSTNGLVGIGIDKDQGSRLPILAVRIEKQRATGADTDFGHFI